MIVCHIESATNPRRARCGIEMPPVTRCKPGDTVSVCEVCWDSLFPFRSGPDAEQEKATS